MRRGPSTTSRRDRPPQVTDIRLARAEPRHLAAVLDMVRDYHAYDHLPFDADVVRPILETLIGNDALGRLFLVHAGEDVIGYLVLGFGFSVEYLGRDAWVDEFFIAEGWRGRGAGRHVLELIKAEAVRLGIQALHLEVTRGNARVQRLYGASGFRDHDRTLMTWWDRV